MKQDLNETGATVMVAPVVFTSVLLALALATLASATDETGDAVFKLTQKGVALVEVAPGIDRDRDVLSRMEFTPVL